MRRRRGEQRAAKAGAKGVAGFHVSGVARLRGAIRHHCHQIVKLASQGCWP